MAVAPTNYLREDVRLALPVLAGAVVYRVPQLPQLAYHGVLHQPCFRRLPQEPNYPACHFPVRVVPGMYVYPHNLSFPPVIGQ